MKVPDQASETTDIQMLPLPQATEYLGTDDPEALQRSAKRFGCLETIGGIPLVNVTAYLQLAVNKAVERAQNPKERSWKPSEEDKRYAIAKAQIATLPGYISKREEKISDLETKLASGDLTPRETRKVKTKLGAMKSSLADLKKKLEDYEQEAHDIKYTEDDAGDQIDSQSNAPADAAEEADSQPNSSDNLVDGTE